jgi:hypothetical protein
MLDAAIAAINTSLALSITVFLLSLYQKWRGAMLFDQEVDSMRVILN